MDARNLEKFKKMQLLKLNWRKYTFKANEVLVVEDECVTVKISTRMGTDKILAVNTCGVLLYEDFFKGTTLLEWEAGEPYSILKQKVANLVDGDAEMIFYEIVNILVWWRMLTCEEGMHYAMITSHG